MMLYFVSLTFLRYKLGDKEQIDIKEPFPMTNLFYKDKEHLALRNNFSIRENRNIKF